MSDEYSRLQQQYSASHHHGMNSSSAASAHHPHHPPHHHNSSSASPGASSSDQAEFDSSHSSPAGGWPRSPSTAPQQPPGSAGSVSRGLSLVYMIYFFLCMLAFAIFAIGLLNLWGKLVCFWGIVTERNSNWNYWVKSASMYPSVYCSEILTYELLCEYFPLLCVYFVVKSYVEDNILA